MPPHLIRGYPPWWPRECKRRKMSHSAKCWLMIAFALTALVVAEVGMYLRSGG
jgi:hypothetical protein